MKHINKRIMAIALLLLLLVGTVSACKGSCIECGKRAVVAYEVFGQKLAFCRDHSDS